MSGTIVLTIQVNSPISGNVTQIVNKATVLANEIQSLTVNVGTPLLGTADLPFDVYLPSLLKN